jgi:hypothetical protein
MRKIFIAPDVVVRVWAGDERTTGRRRSHRRRAGLAHVIDLVAH